MTRVGGHELPHALWSSLILRVHLHVTSDGDKSDISLLRPKVGLCGTATGTQKAQHPRRASTVTGRLRRCFEHESEPTVRLRTLC
jgi:hypothetical protein